MNRKSDITVIRASTMGFCMGVRRVMQIVYDLLDSEKEKPICTLGPLIHNRLVLQELEMLGVRQVETPGEVDRGTVVIRAHGVPPLVRKAFEEKKIKIVDGTCPRVLRSQKIVREHSEKGGHTIIVGDENHGEVKAIAGYAVSPLKVVQDIRQAENLTIRDNTLVIGQTTLTQEEYELILSVFSRKNSNITICQSICPATQKRQQALTDLCRKVDAVIVIGGKESSNTRRLFLTAEKEVGAAWHIEEAREIPEELKRYRIIGITAGASTPDWIIDEVEEMIVRL
ncbi:MAG: 4-hydroxy-3-methylbut-2-enyl diphosphate reductase [Spirochaetota bacterium]